MSRGGPLLYLYFQGWSLFYGPATSCPAEEGKKKLLCFMVEALGGFSDCREGTLCLAPAVKPLASADLYISQSDVSS
jgi:hypothetical protein